MDLNAVVKSRLHRGPVPLALGVSGADPAGV